MIYQQTDICSVFDGFAGEQYTWESFVLDTDVNERRLFIFQHHVVAWLMPFDQGVFQQQCIVFRFYNGEFDVTLFEMITSDLLWLLFLGIICTSVAFLITIEVVKKLCTLTVSLSINLEPIYTILLAIVLLHEHTLLSKEFYIGATIIVLVVLGNTVLNRPKKMQ